MPSPPWRGRNSHPVPAIGENGGRCRILHHGRGSTPLVGRAVRLVRYLAFRGGSRRDGPVSIRKRSAGPGSGAVRSETRNGPFVLRVDLLHQVPHQAGYSSAWSLVAGRGTAPAVWKAGNEPRRERQEACAESLAMWLRGGVYTGVAGYGGEGCAQLALLPEISVAAVVYFCIGVSQLRWGSTAIATSSAITGRHTGPRDIESPLCHRIAESVYIHCRVRPHYPTAGQPARQPATLHWPLRSVSM